MISVEITEIHSSKPVHIDTEISLYEKSEGSSELRTEFACKIRYDNLTSQVKILRLKDKEQPPLPYMFCLVSPT